MTTTPAGEGWIALRPPRAKALGDARLQFHYAAQFASALGISYLARRPDDSHTNLGWDSKLMALRSRETRAPSHGVRVAVRPSDLTLLVLVNSSVGQRIPLHGTTISQAESLLRSALAGAGLDGRRLTLHRHYDLPIHPVAGGHAFDTGKADDFGELAHWYANAALALGDLRNEIGSSEVRCWPHHFDIATLSTVAPGRTVGIGMTPGDTDFPEPYLYVNANPAPDSISQAALPSLEGDGRWNADGWFGAVLPGSRLVAGPGQPQQVTAFLTSAVRACTELVRQ
jgi:hypothetical protein